MVLTGPGCAVQDCVAICVLVQKEIDVKEIAGVGDDPYVSEACGDVEDAVPFDCLAVELTGIILK